MMDFTENLQKCQGYIKALEDERCKIQVFQRELPLCLELVTQAIEACKQQLSSASGSTECFNVHGEYTEQTTSDGPIFEEFIPLKRSNSYDDEDEEPDFNKDEMSNDDDDDKSGKKSDWLRSVQLWNQTPDPPTTQKENEPERVSVVEVNTKGAFHPFDKEKTTSNDVKTKLAIEPSTSSCSNAKATGKNDEKDGHSQRKSRRCWSPELHKRFLHALQQLGGSNVATPKQIRELMKVDGLTNDEVKSHLQKYRLHTARRPTSTSNNNHHQQTPQFVVVGGIWMPPTDQYAAMANNTTTSNDTNIHAPVAAMATPSPKLQASALVSKKQQQKQASQLSHEERGSHSHDCVHSNSPSTSSSTHTTTASHPYASHPYN